MFKHKYITMQLRKKYILWYVVTILLLIAWTFFLFLIINKINVISEKLFLLAIALCVFLSFIFVQTRKEFKQGTLNIVKFTEEGFTLITPISYKKVIWSDVIEILYNNDFENNSIYIEVTYTDNNIRTIEILNIFYKTEVDKYFLTHCKNKFVNTLSNTKQGRQSLDDLI